MISKNKRFARDRRLVMAKDLNGAHKLFGGTILAWIDEQAYIEVITLLTSNNVVTKYMSENLFLVLRLVMLLKYKLKL